MAELDIQVLGYPAVHLDGRHVALPLRKAMALVVYLAEAGAPVAREAMATLLWPDADESAARSRLRRTLHKLQLAFGASAIRADRAALRLAPHLQVNVDAHAFQHACEEGDFEQATQLYAGDFLAGFHLDDCAIFEEWAFFRREALRGRLVHALERLIAQKLSSGDHHTAIQHATRLVGLDPLNEKAHRQLIGAHLLAGNRSTAERQLAHCISLLRSELGVAPDRATTELLEQSPEQTLSPRTRYAASQGIHLAYQTLGTGPPDIIVVPGFVSHVERIWEDERCRKLLLAMAALGRLIVFDRRGVGLSDRVGDAPTVEATADDIRTVMDAVGSRKALLVGASEGGPASIQFATQSPERLSALVLYGSLAKGSWSKDYPFALKRRQYDLWLKRLIGRWGGPAELQTFAPSLVGDTRVEAWWAGLLRAASSPGAIKAVLESLRDTDVRRQLPRLLVPTLVLHRTGDRAVRVEAGRHLAANIAGARFIALEGDDHWFWAGEQGPLLAAIRDVARL
jgi:DNA-binding SARP family transcriptional activator/pimeloyl-ACP methyl ester carboxylesterase